MHLGKLGQQFVLKSEKAFDSLTFTGYEIAECSEWYAKKMLRDRTARREYFNVERNRRQRGDLYITQIIDEEMRADETWSLQMGVANRSSEELETSFFHILIVKETQSAYLIGLNIFSHVFQKNNSIKQ